MQNVSLHYIFTIYSLLSIMEIDKLYIEEREIPPTHFDSGGFLCLFSVI